MILSATIKLIQLFIFRDNPDLLAASTSQAFAILSTSSESSVGSSNWQSSVIESRKLDYTRHRNSYLKTIWPRWLFLWEQKRAINEPTRGIDASIVRCHRRQIGQVYLRYFFAAWLTFRGLGRGALLKIIIAGNAGKEPRYQDT